MAGRSFPAPPGSETPGAPVQTAGMRIGWPRPPPGGGTPGPPRSSPAFLRPKWPAPRRSPAPCRPPPRPRSGRACRCKAPAPAVPATRDGKSRRVRCPPPASGGNGPWGPSDSSIPFILSFHGAAGDTLPDQGAPSRRSAPARRWPDGPRPAPPGPPAVSPAPAPESALRRRLSHTPAGIRSAHRMPASGSAGRSPPGRHRVPGPPPR